MCRVFPTTLKGPTRIWFSRLTPNSISTFKELSAQFASHFIEGHRYKKSTACLISVRVPFFFTLRPKDPGPNKRFGEPGLDSLQLTGYLRVK